MAPIASPTLAVSEMPLETKIMVRGRDATPALVQAVTTALGTPPPTVRNTVAAADTRAILWLGPGEWRVVAPPDEAPVVLAALRAAVPRTLAAVVDVSDSYTTIRLVGPSARTVLTQGCPLDLHPRAFRAGQCAQSLLGEVDVLLHLRDDAPTIDLQVRWSHAAHLWTWLAIAAAGLSPA
jgi:sarcosine oxidase subunit gamma